MKRTKHINQHWILHIFATVMVFGMSLASYFIHSLVSLISNLMFQSVASSVCSAYRVHRTCVYVCLNRTSSFVYLLFTPMNMLPLYAFKSNNLFDVYLIFFFLCDCCCCRRCWFCLLNSVFIGTILNFLFC